MESTVPERSTPPGPMGVVIDTSVFVAAGFRSRSASGELIDSLRSGTSVLVWNAPTRRETERIIRTIPPLSWEGLFAALFDAGHEFTGAVDPAAFSYVPDPDDRKFAALASAVGVPLVTLDRHLLEAIPPAGLGAGRGFVAFRPNEWLDRNGGVIPRVPDR